MMGAPTTATTTTIRTRPDNPSSNALSSNEERICKICIKQFASYTCPRCNLQYCSVPCYKSEKHASCTESFYKDSIMSELDGHKSTPTERTRMLQILRKFERENDHTAANEDDDGDEAGNDEHAVPDLAERLESLDLQTADSDTILSKLTPAERAEFEASLRAGPDAMRGYVDIWAPWWWDDDADSRDSETTTLIRHMDGTPVGETELRAAKPQRPPVLGGLKSLRTLMAGKPDESVVFNLVDLIGAYAFMSRFLNGDWQEDPVEGARIMWDVSRVVGSEQPFAFSGVHDALASLKMRMMQNESYGVTAHTTALNLADISRILSSPQNVLSALSDAHNIFTAAHTIPTSHSNSTSPSPAPRPPLIPRAMRRRAFASAKKLFFYVCLLSETGKDDAGAALLPVLKAAVDLELGVVEREIVEMKDGVKAAVGARRGVPRGPLVQEI
ncbi:hypothetical protein HDU88_007477 [Geranomyces variabilis]|nr:hypothetical protein HDU88_007477 [Geranomyces variabilis]